MYVPWEIVLLYWTIFMSLNFALAIPDGSWRHAILMNLNDTAAIGGLAIIAILTAT